MWGGLAMSKWVTRGSGSAFLNTFLHRTGNPTHKGTRCLLRFLASLCSGKCPVNTYLAFIIILVLNVNE